MLLHRILEKIDNLALDIILPFFYCIIIYFQITDIYTFSCILL